MADTEHRDELPDELDVSSFVGPYQFPDNSRRRIPGYLYLGVAVVCFLLWLGYHDGGVLVNDGFLYVSIFLALVGVYCITSGWHLGVDEKGALRRRVEGRRASPSVTRPRSSGWRGLRSRPTWRILLYSAEEPPKRRGFVLVDAVDGHIVDHFTEDNPEDWTEEARPVVKRQKGCPAGSSMHPQPGRIAISRVDARRHGRRPRPRERSPRRGRRRGSRSASSSPVRLAAPATPVARTTPRPGC